MATIKGTEQRLVHTSPIPKKGKLGKWRLIVDLSSPKSAIVNDGIGKEATSISYPTVDHLTLLVQQVGRGSLLVKADVKEAYRNIPIHPDDQWLLGVEWDGVTYIDGALPFGLRSAPKLLSAIADAAQWVLRQKGVKNVLQYLDDFILVERDLKSALQASLHWASH
uniref:Reverse transcriptase domain-containing protein n=1 Tax=Amphimedon queenslandica TaxID=400682 RepID=A0A1X7VJK1_AMPQE